MLSPLPRWIGANHVKKGGKHGYPSLIWAKSSNLPIPKELRQRRDGRKWVMLGVEKAPRRLLTWEEGANQGQGAWTLRRSVASCTSGPGASPNSADYFTLLGALQHAVDNELASCPAPEGNRREGGYEIPRIVLCLSRDFSHRGDDGPYWVIRFCPSAGSRTQGTGLPSSCLGDKTVSVRAKGVWAKRVKTLRCKEIGRARGSNSLLWDFASWQCQNLNL